MRSMLAVIQFALVSFICISSQVSGQNQFNVGITCYTKYNHEETRTHESKSVVSYAYQKAETTRYAAPDGQLCSKVGCVCYSYQAVCSHSPVEPNQISSCTDTDRQNQATVWHHGLTSNALCEEMRRHPYKYQSLTCCGTDRCNDQPGTLTKIVDANIPSQLREIYAPQQNPQHSPVVQHPSPYHEKQHQNPSPRHETHQQSSSAHYQSRTHKPSQHYENHPRHPTTTHLPESHRPSQAYDRSVAPYNAVSSNCVSKWIISSVLLCCFSVVMHFY